MVTILAASSNILTFRAGQHILIEVRGAVATFIGSHI